MVSSLTSIGKIAGKVVRALSNVLGKISNIIRQQYNDLGKEPDTVYVVYTWRVVRDERLCPRCAALDGQKMVLGQAEARVLYSNFVGGLHPNCRCSTESKEVLTLGKHLADLL